MSEVAEDYRAPESQAEKIAHVTELINESNDIQPDKSPDQPEGEPVQSNDVREQDSGSEPVDIPPSESPASVEDDQQEEPIAATGGDGDTATLGKLAEHLGLDPADLYDVEIPIGEGVTATLGQLKDEFKDYGPAKEYQATLERERGDFERQTLQTRSELNAILNVIPEHMRAAVINEAQSRNTSWVKEQEDAVLEAIPSWSDVDKRSSDRDLIVQYGAEYGFSEAEITYTQDHRTLRALRDAAVNKRELESMRAAAKTQPGTPSAPGKARGTTKSTKLSQLLKTGKAEATMQGKAAVVSQLLRNQ